MIKQIFRSCLPVLAAGMLYSSCNNAGTQPGKRTTQSPDTIRVEPIPVTGAVPFAITEGTVYWSAKKNLGSTHTGIIPVSRGELLVNQAQLINGSVTMNMRGIAVTNMNDAGEKANFESHLKDKDFFEVEKFPEATFVIEEVLPSNLPAFNCVVRGKLTIKKKSHPVNVPVRLTISGDELQAESASFVIDRTKWDINFRSGILGTAKDKIVEDIVPLSLKIRAKRK